MTAFAQIITIIPVILILFFLISIIDFMKKKTKNDELLINKLDQLLERLTDKKSNEYPKEH